MIDKKVVATISLCHQIGTNDFVQRRFSRVFYADISFSDVLQWAESMGLKDPMISDIQFSEYTGSSS